MICESITLNERSKSQKLLIVWLCLHEMSTIEQKKKNIKMERLPIAQDWGVGEDREAVKSDF